MWRPDNANFLASSLISQSRPRSNPFFFAFWLLKESQNFIFFLLFRPSFLAWRSWADNPCTSCNATFPPSLSEKSETLCVPSVLAWISSRKFETFSAIFAQLFYLPAGESLIPNNDGEGGVGAEAVHAHEALGIPGSVCG